MARSSSRRRRELVDQRHGEITGAARRHDLLGRPMETASVQRLKTSDDRIRREAIAL